MQRIQEMADIKKRWDDAEARGDLPTLRSLQQRVQQLAPESRRAVMPLGDDP